MPAAARLGDNTSHGTPLGPGPGSANVRIGGQAAWRAIADFHACPQVDPPAKAHVGGTVLQGSSKVRINGMPAAREGDPIAETGTMNSVAVGLSAVQIGG
jgi:uncharacterized Zn-binding protein involved in type VI secretion